MKNFIKLTCMLIILSTKAAVTVNISTLPPVISVKVNNQSNKDVGIMIGGGALSNISQTSDENPNNKNLRPIDELPQLVGDNLPAPVYITHNTIFVPEKAVNYQTFGRKPDRLEKDPYFYQISIMTTTPPDLTKLSGVDLYSQGDSVKAVIALPSAQVVSCEAWPIAGVSVKEIEIIFNEAANSCTLSFDSALQVPPVMQDSKQALIDATKPFFANTRS